MVVLLRAKPQLSQSTMKNILFPPGTLIFGLLWGTKHHQSSGLAINFLDIWPNF